MGFFSDLGNWVWEGIILNFIFGGIGVAALLLFWGLIYWILIYLSENRVYQGLLTTDDDHPAGVVLVCLLTPPLFVGMIGLIIGLLVACINAILIFLFQLIPFFDWGEKDAYAHFENLNYLWTIPLQGYELTYYFLMAIPILAIAISILSIVACFGYLIPRGDNTGVSLGNSNAEYAALSVSIFLSVISIVLIATFHQLEQICLNMNLKTMIGKMVIIRLILINQVKVLKSNSILVTIPLHNTTISTSFGRVFRRYTGEIVTSEAGRFECLSLNTLSDDVDAFKLLWWLAQVPCGDNRTGRSNVSVMGAKNDFFQTTYGDTNTYHSHPTDLPQIFI